MAITQVSNSLVKQDLTISGGSVDNTVIGSGTPAAGTFTTIAGTLASTVTGTTAAASDNSTKIATTAYVTTALANLVDSAPGTLNTLNELAAALGDDANFATTVTNSIATKANIAAPNFTGNVTFDTTTLTVDASNNRVGIGTASPGRLLTLFNNDQPVFQITNNTSGTASTRGLIQYIANGSTTAVIDNQGSGSGGQFSFMQAGTTRMIIDTSGNLQVGTTQTFPAFNNVVGCEVGGFGMLSASRAGAESLQLNRKTSDGAIALFKKDGSDIGSISTNGGALIVKGTSTSAPVQLQTHDGNEDIEVDPDGFIKMETGGSERLRITAGKVSIGTTAVASATSASLHVADPSVDVQAVFGDNLASIDDPQIRVIGRDSANSAIRYLFTGLDADANHGFIGYNAGAGAFQNALTFDTSGSVAIGTTNTTVFNGIGLKIANATAARLLLQDSTNGVGATDGFAITAAGTNAYAWNQESGFLSLGTSALERLHITAAGQVGIGTSGTKGLLHVYEGNSGQGSANGNFDKLVLEDSSHSGMTILGGANTHGAIYFGDPDVNDVGQIKYKHNDDALCLTTNSQERWKIDSGGSIRQGGSINFMNSALTQSKFWLAKSRDILGGTDDHAVYYTETGIHHQFWLGGARRVNIMNTGITFGTDTAQANTLDDYEEGTFQTQLTCSSGAITLNGQYDDLAYTKIGNVVNVTGYLSVASVSSPSGILFIGLPFSSASGHKHSASASVSFNVLSSGETIDAWPIIDQNSNTIQIYLGNGGSVSAGFASRMVTSSDIRIQATYFAA